MKIPSELSFFAFLLLALAGTIRVVGALEAVVPSYSYILTVCTICYQVDLNDENLKNEQLDKAKLQSIRSTTEGLDDSSERACLLNRAEAQSLQPIEKGTMVSLPCKHSYHHQCIEKYFILKKMQICPFCRRIFSPKVNYIHVYYQLIINSLTMTSDSVNEKYIQAAKNLILQRGGDFEFAYRLWNAVNLRGEFHVLSDRDIQNALVPASYRLFFDQLLQGNRIICIQFGKMFDEIGVLDVSTVRVHDSVALQRCLKFLHGHIPSFIKELLQYINSKKKDDGDVIVKYCFENMNIDELHAYLNNDCCQMNVAPNYRRIILNECIKRDDAEGLICLLNTKIYERENVNLLSKLFYDNKKDLVIKACAANTKSCFVLDECLRLVMSEEDHQLFHRIFFENELFQKHSELLNQTYINLLKSGMYTWVLAWSKVGFISDGVSSSNFRDAAIECIEKGKWKMVEWILSQKNLDDVDRESILKRREKSALGCKDAIKMADK